VALKVALMGGLAQVGLAIGTAVGAWTNLLLVLTFAVRRGYLELDRALIGSIVRFLAAGVILGLALWLLALERAQRERSLCRSAWQGRRHADLARVLGSRDLWLADLAVVWPQVAPCAGAQLRACFLPAVNARGPLSGCYQQPADDRPLAL